ncbi:MAG: NAD-dependent succinate-semialdehyde dehydrogenase [Melioribacteraceae bacterium]|nr:NAD-dependent succinate-semialdehyde dehydrogenase [Melioribacteraceae bacterium]
MTIKTINPATNKVVKIFEDMSDNKVENIIADVHEEYFCWRKTTFPYRKGLLLKAAEILKNEKEKFGEILTLEMGKPITQAIAEVEKCAWVCEYYAENAGEILKNEIIKTDASESFVRFDPIGIVLAVMPWNFPFWQVFRFAAPALMAGNVCLLKHASNVPMSALAIEEVFNKAGFPKNIFKTLLVGSSRIKGIIENPKISAVTLTGSEIAGKEVAANCGSQLKKCVMELGGSDPFIILNDADIEEAVKVAVTARIINNGQSCIAAKRFIVVEDVYDQFTSAFVERMINIKTGDPFEEETELGPLAREDLLIELDEQIKSSVEKGAEILCGGKRLERDGYFYPATVVGNVKKGMPAYEEELFGPAASVIKVKDEEEAIFVANDTEFGLGASLWTQDLSKAKSIASRIESGSVFINGLVKSDPRLPFGGVKISGFGRELSHYGIKEFVNVKTVWIK